MAQIDKRKALTLLMDNRSSVVSDDKRQKYCCAHYCE